MRVKSVQREQLTNELLRKVFKNNFQLTNQAILLCRYYIRSGHEIDMDKILDEVRRNPSEDYLKDLMALEHEDDDASQK